MKLDKLFCITLLIIFISWFILTIHNILSPFIFAAIIAYLLNPLITKLKTYNIPRSLSSIVIIIAFFTVIFLVFTNLLPALFYQFSHFINGFPIYINNFLTKFSIDVGQFGQNNSSFIDNNLSKIFSSSNDVFNNIANSTNAAIDILSAIVITPIISFYFLKDWGEITNFIDDNLPKKYKKDIENILMEIDQIISQYLHGQLMVCLILGTVYALALSHLGLNYGFLIGLVTGILSFIPYVGMLIGVLTSYIIALSQWGFDIYYMSIIAMIFIVGQLLESNYCTPKLVGDQVGIHPVWIIFGLFVFGILFGFVGLLMAIPLTAISKILLQYFGRYYRKKYC